MDVVCEHVEKGKNFFHRSLDLARLNIIRLLKFLNDLISQFLLSISAPLFELHSLFCDRMKCACDRQTGLSRRCSSIDIVTNLWVVRERNEEYEKRDKNLGWFCYVYNFWLRSKRILFFWKDSPGWGDNPNSFSCYCFFFSVLWLLHVIFFCSLFEFIGITFFSFFASLKSEKQFFIFTKRFFLFIFNTKLPQSLSGIITLVDLVKRYKSKIKFNNIYSWRVDEVDTRARFWANFTPWESVWRKLRSRFDDRGNEVWWWWLTEGESKILTFNPKFI